MYRRGSEKRKGTTCVQGEALSVSIIDSSPKGRAKEEGSPAPVPYGGLRAGRTALQSGVKMERHAGRSLREKYGVKRREQPACCSFASGCGGVKWNGTRRSVFVKGKALSVSFAAISPKGRAKEVFRYFGKTKFFDGLKNYVFPKIYEIPCLAPSDEGAVSEAD